MANVTDCFTLGSVVKCTTCFNQEVEGEVLAFECSTRLLVLKTIAENSKELNDVHILNLSLCSNIELIRESTKVAESPEKIDVEQLKMHLRNSLENRHTLLKSKNPDATPEAQELFKLLSKQFRGDGVSWGGLNIHIFNEVIIVPPYKSDNIVVVTKNKRLVNYVEKVLDLFYQKINHQNPIQREQDQPDDKKSNENVEDKAKATDETEKGKELDKQVEYENNKDKDKDKVKELLKSPKEKIEKQETKEAKAPIQANASQAEKKPGKEASPGGNKGKGGGASNNKSKQQNNQNPKSNQKKNKKKK